MKTLYFLLIPLFLFASCKSELSNEITVVGYLQGSELKEITLSSDDLVYSTHTDSSGRFTLNFNSNQSRVYQLKYNGKLNLFLIPGDSLIIHNDGDDYEYSGGQSAELSTYYLDWDEHMKSIRENFDRVAYFSKEPNDFVKITNAYLDSMSIPLNDLVKKMQDIHPEFLRLENENLKYWIYWDLNIYAATHKSYTGKEADIKETFYDYFDEVNLKDTTLLQLDNYKGFLSSYIFQLFRKEIASHKEKPRDKYQETNILLNILSREFKNQRILDEVCFKIMYDRTVLLKVDDECMNTLKDLCANNKYLEEIENKYHELQFLMPGNPAPDFEFYDAIDRKYTLSDFKGKYLFIDVWGAFCGPCRKEAPYLNQIEHDYMNDNIAFVGVCFENNSEIWQERINEFKFTGLQLRAVNSWNSKFKDDYKIQWVPTYILIDTKGKIIDARAPRPSENLRELLDNKCI